MFIGTSKTDKYRGKISASNSPPGCGDAKWYLDELKSVTQYLQGLQEAGVLSALRKTTSSTKRFSTQPPLEKHRTVANLFGDSMTDHRQTFRTERHGTHISDREGVDETQKCFNNEINNSHPRPSSIREDPNKNKMKVFQVKTYDAPTVASLNSAQRKSTTDYINYKEVKTPKNGPQKPNVRLWLEKEHEKPKIHPRSLPTPKQTPKDTIFRSFSCSVEENYFTEAWVAEYEAHRLLQESMFDVRYRWNIIDLALNGNENPKEVVKKMKQDAEKNWKATVDTLGRECTVFQNRSSDDWLQNFPEGKDDAPATDIATLGPNKNKRLWQNTKQVKASGKLDGLTKQQINFHEAVFEIFTSQTSYINSLRTLDHIYIKPIKKAIPNILQEEVYATLFSKVKPIIKAAGMFYEGLNQLWLNDVFMVGLCEFVEKYYEKFGQLYISYARNVQDMVEDFNNELKKNKRFEKLVKKISEETADGKLSLYSFLNMPIQRITRMPLLFKSVVAQAEIDSLDYNKYSHALCIVDKLAVDCNEEVKKMGQFKEMLQISQELLTFAEGVHQISLFKSSRHLVLRASAKKIKATGPRFRGEKVELFLFNDIFLYAQKHKKDKNFEILDHCTRDVIKAQQRADSAVEFTLHRNCKFTKRKLVFQFELTSETTRWLTEMSESMPKERVLEDLPSDDQVVILQNFIPDDGGGQQLALDVGDVVTLFDEQDEQLYGERLLTGVTGWFPASCAKKIVSPNIKHLNATIRNQLRSTHLQSNMRQSYSQTYEYESTV